METPETPDPTTIRTIVLPNDLYERVKIAAKQDHRTAQGEILALLDEALNARARSNEAA